MRDTCANVCERLAVIYVDIVMWPKLIHHPAPVPLCAECYVDLWMQGVQMGTRDVDGELRLHAKLGRYDRTA